MEKKQVLKPINFNRTASGATRRQQSQSMVSTTQSNPWQASYVEGIEREGIVRARGCRGVGGRGLL